jgi:hypothetical protein
MFTLRLDARIVAVLYAFATRERTWFQRRVTIAGRKHEGFRPVAPSRPTGTVQGGQRP